jgi:phospholipid-translocating ATPase
MFYKNIVIVLPQYFLNVISHFSGQKLYHDALYQTYNVFFTALPVLFFGIFDQDVSKECSLACPELYQLGQERHYFNNVIFIQWIVNGIWHAIVVFFVPYYTFAEGAIASPDGKAPDLWLLGTIVFFMVMVVVNLKILIESYLLIWVTWLGIALSLLAWICLQSMLSMYPGVSYEAYGSMSRLFTSPTFPMVVLLTSIIAVARDVHWKTYKRTWCPELYHEVQRQVFQNEVALKKQGAAATFVEPTKKRSGSGTRDNEAETKSWTGVGPGQ